MPDETVETLIIGGGQAGLAMSEQLSRRGLPHLIVERGRVAERWRSERWDSLHANGPAWHDRLPSLPIDGVDPGGFATHDQLAAYFEAYANRIAAPIRCGVTVTSLRTKAGDHVDDPHESITVSGAYGGHTIEFRDLAARGVTLLGRTSGYDDGVLHFSGDLAALLAEGDATYLSFLDAADAYVARRPLDLPEEPSARQIPPDPSCVTAPLLEINLEQAGITHVL